MIKLSRRDFLKLGGSVISSGLASSLLSKTHRSKADAKTPNIVVLICDAMAAKNLSLYGYPRNTTPNLEKIAEQALIYHNHYANGNFTIPGTSSLLTGLLPWTHRAINGPGMIRNDLAYHNIFHFLGKDYFKLAFTQNHWAEFLLNQMSVDINSLIPPSEFTLLHPGRIQRLFKNDQFIANRSLERMNYYNNSLLFSFMSGLYYLSKAKEARTNEYPRNFPVAHYYDYIFTMGNLFDGIKDVILDLESRESPFFCYFHIFPPHNPYAPSADFDKMFDDDDYQIIEKPNHTLSNDVDQGKIKSNLNKYDAFVANIDKEIGRLFSTLKEQGVLDNTYFIITADHGEMFERGQVGHATALLYEPVIKIPLIVLAPNNQIRQDIYIPTHNIDLLPTLLSLTGRDIPATSEGKILPGLGGNIDPNRSIIAVEALGSSAFRPFTKATYSIRKGDYKLIYYHGYEHKYHDYYEFYDLVNDAEEIQDKYSKPRFAEIIENMKKELFSGLEEANNKLLAT